MIASTCRPSLEPGHCAMAAALLAVALFPPIALWLPGVLGYNL